MECLIVWLMLVVLVLWAFENNAHRVPENDDPKEWHER